MWGRTWGLGSLPPGFNTPYSRPFIPSLSPFPFFLFFFRLPPAQDSDFVPPPPLIWPPPPADFSSKDSLPPPPNRRAPVPPVLPYFNALSFYVNNALMSTQWHLSDEHKAQLWPVFQMYPVILMFIMYDWTFLTPAVLSFWWPSMPYHDNMVSYIYIYIYENP